MIFLNILSYVLVLVGAFNWGLFGIFDFNLVGWIFGGARTAGSIIIYVLVALAAIWLIISPIVTGRGLLLAPEKKERRKESAIEAD